MTWTYADGRMRPSDADHDLAEMAWQIGTIPGAIADDLGWFLAEVSAPPEARFARVLERFCWGFIGGLRPEDRFAVLLGVMYSDENVSRLFYEDSPMLAMVDSRPRMR